MDIWTIAVSIFSSGVVGAAIAFGMKKYLGSYLEEKGKNLATKEDIKIFADQVLESEKAKIEAQTQSIEQLITNTKALTATTETIRAKVIDETWDRQERWKAKHAMYRELVEALTELYDAIFQEYLASLIGGEKVTESQLLRFQSTSAQASQKLKKVYAISHITVDTEALEHTRILIDRIGVGVIVNVKNRMALISDGLTAVAIAARADLGYSALSEEHMVKLVEPTIAYSRSEFISELTSQLKSTISPPIE